MIRSSGAEERDLRLKDLFSAPENLIMDVDAPGRCYKILSSPLEKLINDADASGCCLSGYRGWHKRIQQKVVCVLQVIGVDKGFAPRVWRRVCSPTHYRP